MVQVLPYGHADLLAADCSIRTAKLKAVGSAGAFAACGCGRLPNGPDAREKLVSTRTAPVDAAPRPLGAK
jgi:hypothetical protein